MNDSRNRHRVGTWRPPVLAFCLSATDPLAGAETLLVRRRSRLLRGAWLSILRLPDEVARAWPTHLGGGGKSVGYHGRAEASCRQSRW